MKRYFNFIFLVLFSVQLLFAQETVLSRPQEPIKPYPYISEDIVFSNEDANISLSGTMTYPTGGTNMPVVILISGSGPQDRNEELLGHKPFLVLSDYLTKKGIAVLRYDERGVGASGGNFGTATTLDFASDVRSAIDYLRTREDINPSKIGLIGHSEGGLISFMLAAENDDVAFLVSMAGPGMRGDSLLQMQRKAVFKANGASDAAIEENEMLLIKLQDIALKYSAEDIVKNIDSIARDILPASLCDNVDAKKGLVGQLMMISAPWFSYFMTYDPTDALKNITCPVLAINGEKDAQVDAIVNLQRIKLFVESNGNKNVTTKLYPNLNHLFQHCTTGSPNEYSQIEETISPEVLSDISDFILTQNE